MDKNDLTQTMPYNAEEVHQETVRKIIEDVTLALNERGYNAVNQLAGYLITNDPAYISSHKGARSTIQQLERFEIIEELVRYYLNKE
ncbi:MAG: IreB family regulatory phosphoprotein [Erysipelothrix sp.]|nr:IreB family regulatory phosphoprotein [Erysipelothrix sp.]